MEDDRQNFSTWFFLPGFIQQQFRLIPFMEKNLLRWKVDRPVRLHIFFVTLHSPASCEDEFFLRAFYVQ